jgi:predicted esterase
MTDDHILHVETPTHGRVILRKALRSPAPLLVGFHGYGENANDLLDRMGEIPGAAAWHCLSIQALHRFYDRRMNRIVASWMTRQDRERAISDNIEYVSRAVAGAKARLELESTTAFVGFSQGVSMAYRAACFSEHACDVVIALAGDAPADIESDAARVIPRVLIGRGSDDDWYTDRKLGVDLERLERMDSAVDVVRFEGGHEWTDAFREAAGRVLREVWGH